MWLGGPSTTLLVRAPARGGTALVTAYLGHDPAATTLALTIRRLDTASEPPARVAFSFDGLRAVGREAVVRREQLPGEFLVGGYIFLSEEETLGLTPEAVRAGAHEWPLDPRTWWRLHAADWRNRLYAGRRANRPRIRGGNFGVARELFERVDGFDEALVGYGKEDSELRNRMRNAGARGISLWTRALLCHLSSRVFPGVPRPPTPRGWPRRRRR